MLVRRMHRLKNDAPLQMTKGWVGGPSHCVTHKQCCGVVLQQILGSSVLMVEMSTAAQGHLNNQTVCSRHSSGADCTDFGNPTETKHVLYMIAAMAAGTARAGPC